MNDLLKSLPDEVKKKLREVEQPDWMDPMLATLTDQRFSDENWIFERKLDGERCLVFWKGERVRPRFQGLRRDKDPEEVVREEFPS
jgi:ATP-dependent DNA ligase